MGREVPVVSTGPGEAVVVILSDVHIGAVEHRGDEFRQALAWIDEHADAVVLNGDIVENAVALGKAPGEKLLGQALWPTEQMRVARDLLLPLRDRIVYSTRGNHEGRTRREALLDLSEILAEMLGVPYAGVGGLLHVRAGRQTYALAIHHGRSGGANIWRENQRLLDVYPGADLVCLGHNHALAAQAVLGIEADDQGRETLRERWLVRTGSYMGYADYVREMALAPGRIGSPIIRLGATKDRRITVDTQTLSWAQL
jgi:predicted phosphodiesterase